MIIHYHISTEQVLIHLQFLCIPSLIALCKLQNLLLYTLPKVTDDMGVLLLTYVLPKNVSKEKI